MTLESSKNLKPTLKKIIRVIQRLDSSASFGAKEQILYHQSRFWLFRHLQQNALGSVKTSPEKLPGIVKGIFFFLISLTRLFLVRLKGQKPILIVEHLRLRGYQWDHGDPYFGLSKIDLSEQGELLVLIGLHEHLTIRDVIYGNKVIIPRVILNIFRWAWNKCLLFRNIEMASTIKHKLTPLGLEKYFKPAAYTKRLKQIDADNKFARILLKIINPKCILCVDGYNSNSSLILAAGDKIPTVEYQHGIISSAHIGYSFGQDYDLPKGVLPKHFICWGKLWTQNLDPHFAKNTRIQIGTYEYGLWSREKVSINRPAQGVLFIMQPSVADFIEGQIKLFRNLFPKETIGIRYHPKHQNNIEGLESCEHHFQGNLYDLFMRYEYIVGCFSTSLFEAAAMNKKVFYISEPGFDVYEDILQQAGIKALNTIKDMYTAHSEFLMLDSDEIISQLSNIKANSEISDTTEHSSS